MTENRDMHKWICPAFSSTVRCKESGKRYVKLMRNQTLFYAILLSFIGIVLEHSFHYQLDMFSSFVFWEIILILLAYGSYSSLQRFRLADHIVTLEEICEDDTMKASCNQRLGLLLIVLSLPFIAIILLILNCFQDFIYIQLAVLIGLIIILLFIYRRNFDWLVKKHLAYYTYKTK